MTENAFLTIADIAARFSVNRAQVHRWIASGTLKAVNISSGRGDRNSWRVSADALSQFERARSNRITPPLPASRRKRNDTPRTYY